MRNILFVVCSLVLWVSVSAADKISSQWKCDKASDEHNIAVGDHEGHSYHVGQGKCTAEKGSMGDAKEQEGTWTEFDDMNSAGLQNHGVFIATVAGGDKVYYHYKGSQTWKDGKMESGTNSWTLAGGTGKFKEIKGEGGCKGKGSPDGSSTWNCEGTYTAGK